MSNKNKHLVNFTRGTTASWENLLQNTPEKIDNDTLYFIYDDIETSTFGKLYLGKKLICERVDLSNYYNKNEIDELIPTKTSDLINDNNFVTNNEMLNAISNFSTLKMEIVEEKPIENIKTDTIYLILANNPKEENVYEEWIYINNNWELIGTINIDLSQYYNKAEINNILLNDIIITDVAPPFFTNTNLIIGTKYLYRGRIYIYIGSESIPPDSKKPYRAKYLVCGGPQYYSKTNYSNNIVPITYEKISTVATYNIGDIFSILNPNHDSFRRSFIEKNDTYICTGVYYQRDSGGSSQFVEFFYDWTKIPFGATSLEEYNITNAYSKEEVNNLISSINNISFEITQEKPTENIKTNVIYLIPKENSQEENIYNEWVYINNNWELIGTTDINLSQYALNSQIPIKISDLNNDLIIKEPPYVLNKQYSLGQLFLWNNCLYEYKGQEWNQTIGNYNTFNRIGRVVISVQPGEQNFDPPQSDVSSTVSIYEPGDLYAMGGNNTANSYGLIERLFICTKVQFQLAGYNSSSFRYFYIWKEIPLNLTDFISETSTNIDIPNAKAVEDKISNLIIYLENSLKEENVFTCHTNLNQKELNWYELNKLFLTYPIKILVKENFSETKSTIFFCQNFKFFYSESNYNYPTGIEISCELGNFKDNNINIYDTININFN